MMSGETERSGISGGQSELVAVTGSVVAAMHRGQDSIRSGLQGRCSCSPPQASRPWRRPPLPGSPPGGARESTLRIPSTDPTWRSNSANNGRRRPSTARSRRMCPRLPRSVSSTTRHGRDGPLPGGCPGSRRPQDHEPRDDAKVQLLLHPTWIETQAECPDSRRTGSDEGIASSSSAISVIPPQAWA